ncbi:MAG: thrombospondin type 3 repeat-containing protein [Patescibacteria group bacterium]
MRKFAAQAVFLFLIGIFVFSLATGQVFAATQVSPSNMNGWAFAVQSPDGSGTFVTGPATAPLGNGSARLFTGTNGNQATAIHNTGFSGTLVSDITKLDYSTYAQTISANYPRLIMDVTTEFGTDTLYFDPTAQSQAAAKNVWQNWNAKDGNWTASLFPGFTGGTLSQYVTYVGGFSSQNVTVINRPDTTGGLRMEIGPGSAGDVFDGNVDNFTIGISGADTTYDFDPDVLGVAAPTVTTTAASAILTTTATLNGTANPNGDATTGWFRYATVNPGTCDDTFGTRAPVSGGTSLGSGSTAVVYSQPITGLTSGGTYYFCAIASNGGGTGIGSVMSFTTTVLNDIDADGVSDVSDNCPAVANGLAQAGIPGVGNQTNSDSVMGNGPKIPGDDLTRPNSDNQGDACDTDDDNDGLLDVNDGSILSACGAFDGQAAGHADPTRGDITSSDGNGPSWDTDNDGVVDGIECTVGTNPRTAAAADRFACNNYVQNTLGIAINGDADNDGLLNSWEVCHWNTSPTNANSDGDVLGDCKEVMDINGNSIVDSGDATLVKRAYFGIDVPDWNMDINGNGIVNVSDGTLILQKVFGVYPCL